MGTTLSLEPPLQVPLLLILKSLLLVVVAPLILGIITREYLERRFGPRKFKEVKPYFSLVTLVGLYTILYLIFASKAKLVISHYMDVILLAPIATLFYGITILLLLVLNRWVFKFVYRHHQAVVFTTASKNVALTIAILVSAFGKIGQFMSAYPALMSLFQVTFLVLYLKGSHKVKALLKEIEEVL